MRKVWKALLLIVGAVFLVGASGDLIYGDKIVAHITGVQAANLADAFIALGAWDGNRADMIYCIVERSTGGPTDFRAECKGQKYGAAGTLTYPLEILGVEP